MFQEEGVRTENSMMRVLLIMGSIAAFILIPGVRRFILGRILRNKLMRYTLLQFVVATPYIREKIINQIVPPGKGSFFGRNPNSGSINSDFDSPTSDQEVDGLMKDHTFPEEHDEK